MCLILVAKDAHPRYPLIIVANREEYHSRPTQSLSFWHDYPTIAAGRDLTAGGTWFGLNLHGLFAAVTNFHEPTATMKSDYSRGTLVLDWLRQNPESADCHLQSPGQLQRYQGVNVISGNIATLWWNSNRVSDSHQIPSGITGLSNHLLDTPWHKIVYGKQLFKKILNRSFRSDTFFELLSDPTPAKGIAARHPGFSPDLPAVQSAIFIKGPLYGTRSSTVLLLDQQNQVQLIERSYDPDAAILGENRLNFQLQPLT
jgi:uncharacterized protein with NRDE domain